MMSPLLNAVRLQVQRALAEIVVSRQGVVTSYDPDNYAAKVTIQPDGVISGWLPVAAQWIGNGWGMYAPPSVGDLVEVHFVDASLDVGTVQCRIFNDDERPLSVPSGEFWLVHAKTASVKLTNDGKLTVDDGHGASIQLDGTGKIVSAASQWTHTGLVEFKSAVHFDDNVQVDQTLTANTDVIGGGKSLKNHVHGGVQSGGSNTGPPA